MGKVYLRALVSTCNEVLLNRGINFVIALLYQYHDCHVDCCGLYMPPRSVGHRAVPAPPPPLPPALIVRPALPTSGCCCCCCCCYLVLPPLLLLPRQLTWPVCAIGRTPYRATPSSRTNVSSRPPPVWGMASAPVRNTLERVHKRGRVMRPASQRRLLQVHRDKILCVELRGELFFGSSQQVLQQV